MDKPQVRFLKSQEDIVDLDSWGGKEPFLHC